MSSSSIAFTTGGLIVSTEWNTHTVSVINSTSGTKIRTFGGIGTGPAQFKNPMGVAVASDGNLIITDFCNHRLQVVTPEGSFVKSIGKEGSGKLEFCYPGGIAIHPNGKIYISDTDNHRVQVLNSDLSFSFSFGQKGCLPGLFKSPRGITFDSKGYVYVADRNNNRVQKFTQIQQHYSYCDDVKP